MHTTDQLNAALAGRYTVERLVGEGGMATVYLARDVKHDRHVALKVLKPELGAVLGVERFLSEIKVTANLQHPNLLPLFDSGEAAGLLFYVMPFIEGESLRVKLDREKQLPIDEAVRLSVAVASALDYAHRHGVIHRDLKPENILLHDGQPVIADFGIALAVSKAGGARVTQTGLSLGTPQYMSPEQASGDRAIDARSDIYSLAAMTYELIAGEPPHTGSTAQAIMAKLMTAEPAPLSTLRKSAPVHVEAAVERGLAKLPADRFSTAREFAEALQGRGFALTDSMTSTRRVPGRAAVSTYKSPAFAVAALVAALALGAAAWQWSVARAKIDPQVVRFDVPIPASMLTNNAAAGANIAVSPDGKTIAYVSSGTSNSTRVFLRALDESEARPIPGTEGAQQPFFSPDGRWVGYVVRDQVYKVSLAGGAPLALGATLAQSVGVAWSKSREIVAGTANGILAIPEAGGNPRVIVKPDEKTQELFFNQPVALDDGETILFAISGGSFGTNQLAAVSLKTGTITRTGLPILAPLGVKDGILVFATLAGSLSAIRFDEGSSKPIGEPTPLGINVLVRVSGAADAALSPAGTLVFQAATAESQVGWVDQRGAFTPLMEEVRAYGFPRLSPDGKRIAITVGNGGRSDIWTYDIDSRTPTRLTTAGNINERPEWSHDGRQVLFRTDRTPRSSIWWQPADRSAEATSLHGSAGHDFYEGLITADGKYFVYQIDDAKVSQADVMYRAMSGDTTSKPVSATNFIEAQARVSPDGKWIALATDASGTTQIVVQPFPGPGGQVQVSLNGGTEAVWSRDGKKLYYRDGREFIAASVSGDGGFRVTSRAALFDDPYVFAAAPHPNFDVALDGSRFLMVRNAQTPRLSVVYGWFGEVKARLAAGR
jgi:Tol biopolymer transport system component/tRNA A-37 threonylcarbamoyl transferase component Bud32